MNSNKHKIIQESIKELSKYYQPQNDWSGFKLALERKLNSIYEKAYFRGMNKFKLSDDYKYKSYPVVDRELNTLGGIEFDSNGLEEFKKLLEEGMIGVYPSYLEKEDGKEIIMFTINK